MLLLQTGMAGHVRRLRPDPVLHLLGAGPGPDVLHDRVWGGPRREYASVKFFLYTLFGSVFMLVAFLAIYFQAAGVRPSIIELSPSMAPGSGSRTFQRWAFLGIFLGFAIKVPMWPFHTWLPDAHTEAPTVGSVLLAGVLLKMGTYGFIRIACRSCPTAPSLRADHRRARGHRRSSTARCAASPRPTSSG
jgi:NADH-quinone oxidoreductase subunit M